MSTDATGHDARLEELLPCPFCGGGAVEHSVLRDGYDKWPDDPDARAHSVRCRSCAAEGGWAKSASGARRWWNSRVAALRAPAAGSSETLDAFGSPASQWRREW